MTYIGLHPLLRGSALEGRGTVNVTVENEDEAKDQERLVRTVMGRSGISDWGCGHSHLNDRWSVHFWRGDWSPWAAPDPTRRMVGP